MYKTDIDGAETVEEYRTYNYQIVREPVDGDADRFHFIGAMGQIKAFENLDKARLFVDVYEVVGGFREEETGERGAPPEVARAGENVQIAYYASQPTISLRYVSAHYGIPEEQVRNAVELIRERAEEQREELDNSVRKDSDL